MTTTTTAGVIASPLRHLDADAVSQAARIETRNREVYLPPVSVFRWWARRTEAVNGAVIDAVTAERGLDEPLLVVDPFAGGGVIPLAALVRGHRVYAQDINPWAAAGLTAMLGLPEPEAIREGVGALTQRITPLIGAAYGTTMTDGQPGTVTYTFRVATANCGSCGHRNRLYPHAMVSLLARKERGRPEAILACRNGHLSHGRHDRNSRCHSCRTSIDPTASYTARRMATCANCGHRTRLQDLATSGDWSWDVVLVERARPGTRELATASPVEVATADNPRWTPGLALGVIPHGQETRVLLRHGFSTWADLYPRRQRHVLEQLLAVAPSCSDNAAVVALLRMAIVGSAEMAGLCSRWDRWYLKSYEAMAGHRFNFTTLTVEPNAWGTATSGRGTVLRRLDQLIKAATWLHENTTVGTVAGPIDPTSAHRSLADVVVAEGSSECIALDDGSADLVLTDPPYHDDVQYSELSLPLRAWAGLDVSHLESEAVVNIATGQNDGDDYADLLTRIFTESNRVLRDDGHLIFSFANRSSTAWTDLISALDTSGLRAVGCEIVHSENERDQAKRGVRACTLDLMLDLVPTGDVPVTTHHPSSQLKGDEAIFLRVVATWFLQVGSLPNGWRAACESELASCAFVN
jgi:adenine-specific DNA methylase